MTDTIIVEGFITDQGFVDQSKTINGILISETNQAASLTTKALSYFTSPGVFKDTRAANTRQVNWAATSQPQVVVDEVAFQSFIDTVNNLETPATTGFFKLIDALVFDYTPDFSTSVIETALLIDADISAIYVPGSFAISSTILSAPVYSSSGTTTAINVPTFVKFQLSLLSGSTPEIYEITLFAGVAAFLAGYNVSSIVTVVPPLPYATLFSSSLTNTTDNVFSTATLSAALSFNTTQAMLGTISVSGITEYNVILIDTNQQTASVPFNILYKGRAPTLVSVRAAIAAALLASGVGDEAGWKARIPGVFVSGRFYIIPFWDQTYTKPDQTLFPSIIGYPTIKTLTNTILDSLGFGDVSDSIDVLELSYNAMTSAAVPDLSEALQSPLLHTVIPDYQSFSPDDPEFNYMTSQTQLFALTMNLILAVAAGATTSTAYEPITENLLTFYSFTVGDYEVCVITPACYATIMESTQ